MTDETANSGQWRRLDARMLAVQPLRDIIKVAPLLIVILLSGFADLGRLYLALIVAALAVAAGIMRLVTTRYRVTEQNVELRSGWLTRKNRSVPRERLRTVDITSSLLHRVLQLSVVKVGTGRQDQGKEDELTLDAVSHQEAQQLRHELLAETRALPSSSAKDDTNVLARLDLRWLRFAPLTMTGLAAVGAAMALAFQVIDDLHIDPSRIGVLRDAFHWITESAIITVVLILLAIFLVASTIASCATYLARYWNFVLTRGADGTLHSTRGLFTTRSVSITEPRIRGVQVSEGLLLRAARGALCTAIATGLGTGRGSGLLLPPAEAATAHRIAGVAVRRNTSPTHGALHRHPRAALRRRLVRVAPVAVVPIAVFAALALIGWWPHWPWWVALLLVPVSVALAIDRYRNLGHAIDGEYLVSRSGSLVRETVALQREGIIGWRINRSLFQRRSGLLTLTATTAASEGGYRIVDVGEQEGLELADTAVPELLAPFVRVADSGVNAPSART